MDTHYDLSHSITLIFDDFCIFHFTFYIILHHFTSVLELGNLGRYPLLGLMQWHSLTSDWRQAEIAAQNGTTFQQLSWSFRKRNTFCDGLNHIKSPNLKVIEERVEEWEKGWKETVVISVISVSELLTSKVTAVAVSRGGTAHALPQGFALLLEQQVMATSHSNELSIFTLRVGSNALPWNFIERCR